MNHRPTGSHPACHKGSGDQVPPRFALVPRGSARPDWCAMSLRKDAAFRFVESSNQDATTRRLLGSKPHASRRTASQAAPCALKVLVSRRYASERDASRLVRSGVHAWPLSRFQREPAEGRLVTKWRNACGMRWKGTRLSLPADQQRGYSSRVEFAHSSFSEVQVGPSFHGTQMQKFACRKLALFV